MGVLQFDQKTYDWVFIDDVREADIRSGFVVLDGMPVDVPSPDPQPVELPPVPEYDPLPPDPDPAENRCPSWLQIRRGCGCVQYIAVPCSDPLCVPCSREWSRRVRARWFPVLARMKHPKLLTLTIQSGFDLADRVEVEARSFRRLLNTRLGRRNWPKLSAAAVEFLGAHLETHEHDPAIRADRLRAGLASIEKFGRALARKGAGVRMRELTGPGFSSREVTWSDEHGWHVHRHCTIDGQYIPWPVLVVAWLAATKGAGQVVDIRSVGRSHKDIRELLKYSTKPWVIPTDRAGELRSVLFGKKRVWPLGGAKPDDPERACPGCGDPDCRCVSLAFGSTLWAGWFDGVEHAWVQIRDGGRVLLVRERGRWQDAPYLDTHGVCVPFAAARAGPDPPAGSPSPAA